MSLIVTGTIGIDTVHTPTGSVEEVLGGSCAYFAAAASFLSPVRIVSAVGDDWPADHRAKLTSFKAICTEGLEERAGSKTFRWGGRYEPNMNDRETLFTELGVVEEHPPAIPAAYCDSKFVFLANTHPAVQMGLLEQFPNRTIAMADSMDLWINIAHDDLLALLKKIDGIVINDSEAEQLTEIRNPISAGRKILQMGPKFVIIKKGEHGAVLVHQDGLAVTPAFPAATEQVIDPTGAGDSFAGGLMGHLAATGRADVEAVQEGMTWGTVIASMTVSAFGLEGLAAATRESVDERMADFQRIARVGAAVYA